MLQQTQVDRVMPKYAEFVRKYPSLQVLAKADPRALRRDWYPLGYNARPMRLQATAREAVATYGGRLPKEPEQLDSLPGIGRYTANAVASIAHGRKAAVVDTNVRRVFTRVVYGGRKVHDERIWTCAQDLISDARPGDFNQAVMDLGATLCKPRNPLCVRCPLRSRCAFRTKTSEKRKRQ